MSAPSTGRWLLVAAGIVVAATLVTAVFVMGTPEQQRRMRMDERRIDDLQQIERVVRVHYSQAHALPASLAVIGSQPGMALDLADPETAAPYGYQPQAGDGFSLCATFATDTGDGRHGDRRRWLDPQWAHPAGKRCFALRAAADN
jgi:hypothetical protein